MLRKRFVGIAFYSMFVVFYRKEPRNMPFLVILSLGRKQTVDDKATIFALQIGVMICER